MKTIKFIILFLILLNTVLIAGINHLKKADEYFQKGKFSLAEIFYKKAIGKYPENYQANLNLGKTYYYQKDFKKSLQYLKTAYDLKPNDEIMFHIANAYVKDNHPKKGLSIYSNILKKDPKYADVHLNAGNVGYKYLYNKYITIYHWETFLILAPDDPQAPNIRKALEYLRDPNFILKPPIAQTGKPPIIAGGNGQQVSSITNSFPLIPEIKGKDLQSKSDEKYKLKKKKTITTE